MLVDERIIRTLRQQAWSRAKGELEAVLNSYWSEEDTYTEMARATNEFISLVEDHGLAD